jgi:DNA-binding NarL/FixJ family response regulator
MDRPRILVADDHQAILDRVSLQLAGEFEIIGTAHDGEAALAAALTLKPDAVVLDISMLPMNGLAAARRLTALPDPPRIVFLTVHEDQDFMDEAKVAGGSGYVLKRNMRTHLAAALWHALRRRGGTPGVDRRKHTPAEERPTPGQRP